MINIKEQCFTFNFIWNLSPHREYKEVMYTMHIKVRFQLLVSVQDLTLYIHFHLRIDQHPPFLLDRHSLHLNKTTSKNNFLIFNRIIKSLERYAENADIGSKDQMRFVSDNVVVEIWNLKPTLKPVIGLAAETHGTGLDKPFKAESIATVYNKSHLYEANVDAAIELPAEVFGIKEKGMVISSTFQHT